MWKDTKRKHSAWSHEARWRLGKRPEMVPWPRMKRRGVCHSVYQGGVTGEHAAGPVPCANAIRVYIADMVVERICCAYECSHSASLNWPHANQPWALILRIYLRYYTIEYSAWQYFTILYRTFQYTALCPRCSKFSYTSCFAVQFGPDVFTQCLDLLSEAPLSRSRLRTRFCQTL